MSEIVLLDTGPLGMVTNPRATPANDTAKRWLRGLLAADRVVLIPEIADYELRRELLRIGSRQGLARLDALATTLVYLPLTTAAMRLAAEFWARARRQGLATAAGAALDCDVILAAQASLLSDGDTRVVVATTNVGHLARFVEAHLWNEIK